MAITATKIEAFNSAVFTGDGSGLTGLTASQIPSLGAGKITSGSFAAARIPSLAASKITSGSFARPYPQPGWLEDNFGDCCRCPPVR